VKANLAGARLEGADLRFSDLRQANTSLKGILLFEETHLNSADLRGANLSAAHLTCSDLKDVDLTRANLTGTILERADLTHAILTGTILEEADLTFADFVAGQRPSDRGAHGSCAQNSQELGEGVLRR
jgi:uncharacterized protein YjbI with pentapeptide repeats